jgi:hypothetical protein
MSINQEPPTNSAWAAPGRDFQDARRARGFREGDNDLEYQYVAKAIDIAHGAESTRSV